MGDPISRRAFLRQGLVTGMAMPLFGLVQTSYSSVNPEGQGSDRGPAGTDGCILMGATGFLNSINLKTGKLSQIKTPNKNGHSVLLHPSKNYLAVAIDQDTLDAAVVDRKKRRLVEHLKAQPGHCFSGHGCFSPDGALLYLSEFPVDRKSPGYVRLIDSSTWKTKARYASGAAHTHTILSLQKGKTLAIGHYGTPSGDGQPLRGGLLSFLDSESGKVINLVRAKRDAHSFCHLDKGANDKIVVSAREWVRRANTKPFTFENHLPAPMLFGKLGEPNWREVMPEDFGPQMRLNLTVRVDQVRQRAVVTHMLTERVSVWDLQEEKMLWSKYFPGHRPTGVAFSADGNQYLITAATKCFFLAAEGLSLNHIMDLGPKNVLAPAHLELAHEV